MGIALAGVSILYVFLLVYYRRGWVKLPKAAIGYTTGVTLLIPARNEASNLPDLLQDIEQQQFEGQIEVVVLDDHSTDNTPAIAISKGARVIRLADYPPPSHMAFKKLAITLGVEAASHPWVVTLDADNRIGRWWINALLSGATSDTKMIAGPVLMQQQNGLLGAFQQWDMLGMQLFTGGGIANGHPVLVNGASLAFSKAAFEEVRGFAGATDKASGDDIFLMQKIRQRFGSAAIRYAADHDAVVLTRPMSTWMDLWQQRIRWASKTSRMLRPATLLLMGGAFLFHLCLLVAGVLSLFHLSWLGVFFVVFLLKHLAERWALQPLVRHWRLHMPWQWMPMSQLLYVPYVVVVGFLGNFISYRWKGRKTT